MACKSLPPIADPEKRGFIHGYAVAVAAIVNLHDRPEIAADVLSESGFTLRDFERAEVDAYDLKPIRKLFREKARKRLARRKVAASPALNGRG